MICLALVVLPQAGAYGQEPDPAWSEPANLSNSSTNSSFPSLAVDPAGGVHIIWSEGTERSSVLFYSHLLGENWSTPIDVLVTPGEGPAVQPVLKADSEGYLHAVWIGWGTVYHSSAYAPLAGTAHGWSEPKPLSAESPYTSMPDLAVDPADNLYVVYAELIGSTSGIHCVRSTDHGDTWQVSVAIYQNTASSRMVDRARIASGPDGRLHVVWVEFNYPETFPPIGIRYSYSTDGGASWSQPIPLADGPYDYPGIVSLAGSKVHVVWSGTSADRFKFHRWSPDGGRSWSDTWRNLDVGGYQGWPALAVDGNQNLHWLQVGTVARVGDSLYYNVWNGSEWSPGEVLLPPTASGQNATNVSAAIALGNELHVVVQSPLNTAKASWQYEVFYVHRHLDAAGRPAQPLPTLTPKPSPTDMPFPSPPATEDIGPSATLVESTLLPTAVPSVPAKPAALPSIDSTTLTAIGVLPALLVVVIVAVVILRRRRGSHVR